MQELADEDGDNVGARSRLLAPPGAFLPGTEVVVQHEQVLAQGVAASDGSLRLPFMVLAELDAQSVDVVVNRRTHRVWLSREQAAVTQRGPGPRFVERPSGTIAFLGTATQDADRVVIGNETRGLLARGAATRRNEPIYATVPGQEGDTAIVGIQYRDGSSACFATPCGCAPEQAARGACRNSEEPTPQPPSSTPPI